jgi:hypothetical protein
MLGKASDHFGRPGIIFESLGAFWNTWGKKIILNTWEMLAIVLEGNVVMQPTHGSWKGPYGTAIWQYQQAIWHFKKVWPSIWPRPWPMPWVPKRHMAL